MYATPSQGHGTYSSGPETTSYFGRCILGAAIDQWAINGTDVAQKMRADALHNFDHAFGESVLSLWLTHQWQLEITYVLISQFHPKTRSLTKYQIGIRATDLNDWNETTYLSENSALTADTQCKKI